MTDVMTWQPGVIFSGASLTKADVQAIKDALTTEQVVALTAWAEARSRFEPGHGWVANPIDAMADIVNVIQNRARLSAGGHKGICLARRQFSCWDTLGGPANFYELIGRAQRLIAKETPSDKLLNCLALAHGSIGGAMVDALQAATHYFSPASMIPPGRVPAWVAGATLTADRWGHRFYAGVR